MAEPFKALQIEVTSRCNASCQYCPRTVLHDRWLSRDMDMALFSRIMDGIGMGLSLVYLQGWGEPLMSPNMAEMIRLVKERSGAEVGLTTNGTLLEEEMTEQLLDAGLDIVGVSFAGAEAETHNELRRGCDFDLVVKNTAEFVRKKGPSGGRVRTIASYTMTRQNVQEIPRFVELCDRIGIKEIVLDNLTYTPSEALQESRAFSCGGEKPDGRAARYVDQARRLADGAGIKMFAYSLTCSELANCPEAPTERMFVNVKGEISPCVFTNLPTMDSKVPRCYAGRRHDINKLVFGTAAAKDLGGVWSDGDYRRFRAAFERRTRAVEDAAELLAPVLEPTDIGLPESCRTCYRILGV